MERIKSGPMRDKLAIKPVPILFSVIGAVQELSKQVAFMQVAFMQAAFIVLLMFMIIFVLGMV